MKYILLLSLSISGCASFRIDSDNMQPDGSYRILSAQYGDRSTFMSENIKQEAIMQAQALCPRGYDQRSGFFRWDGRYSLIVMCHYDKEATPTTKPAK